MKEGGRKQETRTLLLSTLRTLKMVLVKDSIFSTGFRAWTGLRCTNDSLCNENCLLHRLLSLAVSPYGICLCDEQRQYRLVHLLSFNS